MSKRPVDPETSVQPSRKRVVAPITTTENTTIVYTDGACTANGSETAQAGIGVYFGSNDLRNVSRPLLTKGPHTNQRAELEAIQEALAITKDDESVDIRTDSQYSISCFQDWLPAWERNGWRNKKNKPVMNQDLIRPILAMIRARKARKLGFRFTKVKGHSGIFGNDEADRLATSGIYASKEEKEIKIN